MPPIVIPDTARSAIRMQQGGRQRVNVLHFRKLGGFTAGELNTLNVALMAWWEAVIRPQMPNNLTLVDITSTNIDDPIQEQDVQPCVTNCTGTIAGEPEPGNVTGTISWRTGLAGRRYRGRSYWPAMLTTQTNNDDTIFSGLVLAMAAAAGNLLFANLGAGVVPAVASRVLLASTPITGWVIDNVLDSMRSRLPGRGV